MADAQEGHGYPLNEALRALEALRRRAGLAPERFPMQAFVGMISDEVETLRGQGVSDEEIAKVIEANSAIRISAREIAENYAPPEQRRHEPA